MIYLCTGCRRLGPQPGIRCPVCDESYRVPATAGLPSLPTVEEEAGLGHKVAWDLGFVLFGLAGAVLGAVASFFLWWWKVLHGDQILLGFALPLVAAAALGLGYRHVLRRFRPTTRHRTRAAVDPKPGPNARAISGTVKALSSSVGALLGDRRGVVSTVNVSDGGARLARIVRASDFAVEGADGGTVIVRGEVWLVNPELGESSPAAEVSLRIEGIDILPLRSDGVVVAEHVLGDGDQIELLGRVTQEQLPESMGSAYRGDAIGDVMRGVPGRPVLIQVRA